MQTRNTKTKELVADIFKKSHLPLLLTEVHQKVKEVFPHTAYSTIYRIVLAFEKNGTLKPIDWRDRGGRYEWADKKHHHHLLCNACGKATDIDSSLIAIKEEVIEQQTGFIIKDHSLEFFGLCPPCQRTMS